LKILVANDDGIDSEGIIQLVKALATEHEVYVCAPDTQRSGTGHGISIKEPVVVTEISLPPARKAYSMSGTPADCVKMGIDFLADEGTDIDMVFSGINSGGNLGTDTLYSGTVSAAIEGSVCGFPSVAVSVNSLRPLHYEYVNELALRAARMDLKAIDEKIVLNINTPDLPAEDIMGVKVVGLGLREYFDWNVKSTDEHGRTLLRYGGRPLFYEGLDADSNDVGASQHGYATITPLHFDLTSHGLIEMVKASGIAGDTASTAHSHAASGKDESAGTGCAAKN
jgi:5'-nucleotidase